MEFITSIEQIPAGLTFLLKEISELKQLVANGSQQKGSIEKEFLTRKEACEVLKVNPNTLLKYTKEGKLKAYRFGGRVLYKPDEIRQALKEMNFGK